MGESRDFYPRLSQSIRRHALLVFAKTRDFGHLAAINSCRPLHRNSRGDIAPRLPTMPKELAHTPITSATHRLSLEMEVAPSGLERIHVATSNCGGRSILRHGVTQADGVRSGTGRTALRGCEVRKRSRLVFRHRSRCTQCHHTLRVHRAAIRRSRRHRCCGWRFPRGGSWPR